MEVPKISIGYKIWFNLERDAKTIPFIGERKIRLLKEIQNTGSINEAAKNLDLEYHKAWDMIESIHDKIEPVKLVSSTRGRGGGTDLSPFAMSILEQYETNIEKIENGLNS